MKIRSAPEHRDQPQLQPSRPAPLVPEALLQNWTVLSAALTGQGRGGGALQEEDEGVGEREEN